MMNELLHGKGRFSTVSPKDPEFPAEVDWLLEEGYFGYLGTSDSHGTPHVTPVIFVRVGNSVFLTISRVARKVTNMRQNERVAFLVDIRDLSNLANNRAVLIQGLAKIYGFVDLLRNLRRVVRVRELFLKKYARYAWFYATKASLLPKPWRATPFISRLLVEVEIRSFTYVRESKPVVLNAK
jgi:nitroimidazol reductase NimA-like FMN-containing flavoprotein (pyridoxamine 5'-phosphate oxidase superfamily)